MDWQSLLHCKESNLTNQRVTIDCAMDNRRFSRTLRLFECRSSRRSEEQVNGKRAAQRDDILIGAFSRKHCLAWRPSVTTGTIEASAGVCVPIHEG